MSIGLSVKFTPTEPWVDYRAPHQNVDFNLTPETAVKFFQAKGLKPTFAWQDMIGDEHDRAFTIAKMMDVDMLGDVRQALDKAIASGQSMGEFIKEMTPALQKAGWWGKQVAIDPLTGQAVNARLGSARRLELIFRTNLQNAYSIGHWQNAQASKHTAPYLMYDALDDSRTRASHAALDGKILPVDSPFWTTHYPPNGWNCRCGTIQLSESDLKDYTLKASPEPKVKYRNWTNPRDGKNYKIPRDLDPGWNHNPGQAYHERLQKQLAEKLAALPPDMAVAGAAAQAAQAKAAQALKTKAAVKAAQKEMAKEASIEAAARQKEKALNAAARHQLQQIEQNKTKYLNAAKNSIEKTKAGQALAPKDLLVATKAKAAKAEQSAFLSAYKSSKMKGKTPSKKEQAAFDKLPDEAQADMTAAIDAKIVEAKAEQAAIDKLADIAANPKGQTLHTKYLGKLAQAEGWGALTPVEKLAKLTAKVDDVKAKDATSAALNGYKKKVLHGEIPTPAQVKVFDALNDTDKQAFLAKVGDEKIVVEQFKAIYYSAVGHDPIKAEVAGFIKSSKKTKKQIFDALAEKMLDDLDIPPPKTPTPAPKAAKPAEFTQQGPVDWDMDDLTQTGSQKGTNQGRSFKNTHTREEFYIKYPDSEDMARNEVLAAKLYEAAGVDVPELTLIKTREGVGVASRIVDKVTKTTAAKLSKAAGAHEGFVVDAWLANWDVTGMGLDNLLLKGKKAIRIDVGGALRYRAQGGAKGAAFGDIVDELDSLRSEATNSYSASVFGKITEQKILAGARKVLAVSDDDIERIVAIAGPADHAERQALVKRLIARKRDIVKRYPEAAAPDKPIAPPTKKGELISAAEAKSVKTSRSNGYSVRTDGDHIEDQQILVWESKRRNQDETNLFLKVRGDGERAVLASIGDTAGPRAAASIDGSLSAYSQAAKGIGMQAGKGEAFRAVDIERLAEASRKIKSDIDTITAGLKTGRYDATQANQVLADLRSMKREITWMRKQAVEGQQAQPWRKFIDTDKINSTILEPATEAKSSSIAWAKTQAKWRESSFERGFAKTDTEYNRFGEMYEATVDGVTIRYYPGDDYFALKNRMEVIAPGHGPAAAQRAMETLEKIGVNNYRSSLLDIEELYLTQIAYHRNINFSAFTRTTGGIIEQEKRIAAMKKWLNDELGIDDITKTRSYNPYGERQAFDTGWQHTYRPDMDGPEWTQFENDYRIHHRITADGMLDAMQKILSSGGSMAPTTDKLRRGIEVRGMSPESDLGTGGASYFFTRIKTRQSAYDVRGLVWRSKHAKRLDSISYNHDAFGKTKGDYVALNRVSTIDGWKDASRNGSNELDFKNGMSIFDGLDRIVAGSASERSAIIKIFKDHGYNKWPDGRALEEVIVAK